MSCHFLLRLLLPLLLIVSASADAAEGERYALVIGNAAYQQPLLNPVNDARAVADRLRQLGFKVLLRTDVSGEQLQKASTEFSTLARGADIALVFYAGHGAQAGEANYLLPLGANIGALNATMVQSQGVAVSRLAGDLQRTGSRSAVLILDACRQEYTRGAPPPNGGNHGFGDNQAPRGIVIAYSAGPGALARDFWSPESRNSPYTSALLDALGAPGLTMSELFARVAENVARMTNDVQKPRVSFGETSSRLVLNNGSGSLLAAPGSNASVAPVAAASGAGKNTSRAPESSHLTPSAKVKVWPGNVLQDINYEIRLQIATRPFPRQQLEQRARGGDVVAQTVLGYGLAGGDAGSRQPKIGLPWLEKAAANGFPIAQTYLAELLIINGDPKSLQRAAPLLDAATAAGYTPAHAYKFDLASRSGAPPQQAAKHLQDALMGLMNDYQGAAKAAMPVKSK